MYSLRPVFKKWENTYSNLKEMLSSINATFPHASMQREIFVEGLFLRFVTSWEHFIEEYFLRCMCDSKTIKKTIIKPIRTYNNTEEAFKALAHNLRKNRDNHYLDWLSDTFLENSIKLHFRRNSRISTNVPNYYPTMKHINTIRNRIVHSSTKAGKDFDNLVRGNFGYLKSSSTSPAELLLSNYKKTTTNIFHYRISELNILAKRLSI